MVYWAQPRARRSPLATEDHPTQTETAPAPRYRYCPLQSGETVEVRACGTCPLHPEPPYRICVAQRPCRPRQRGFWDGEASPLDG